MFDLSDFRGQSVCVVSSFMPRSQWQFTKKPTLVRQLLILLVSPSIQTLQQTMAVSTKTIILMPWDWKWGFCDFTHKHLPLVFKAVLSWTKSVINDLCTGKINTDFFTSTAATKDMLVKTPRQKNELLSYGQDLNSDTVRTCKLEYSRNTLIIKPLCMEMDAVLFSYSECVSTF